MTPCPQCLPPVLLAPDMGEMRGCTVNAAGAPAPLSYLEPDEGCEPPCECECECEGGGDSAAAISIAPDSGGGGNGCCCPPGENGHPPNGCL